MTGRVTRKPCNRVVTLHGDVTTASHPSSVDADHRRRTKGDYDTLAGLRSMRACTCSTDRAAS